MKFARFALGPALVFVLCSVGHGDPPLLVVPAPPVKKATDAEAKVFIAKHCGVHSGRSRRAVLLDNHPRLGRPTNRNVARGDDSA